MARRPLPGLPTREQVLRFIEESPTPVGKREIARAFGLHAQDKIALKALLRDMANDGDLEAGAGRNFHKGGGLPKVTVLRVVEVEEGPVAIPDAWDKGGTPPRVRIVEHSKREALGIGDRILTRIEEVGSGYRAHPMKKLSRSSEFVLGILREDKRDQKGGGVARSWRLVPVDKRARLEINVSDPGEAEPGDLVLVEPTGRPPRQTARVVEVLGDPFAPRSFSLIAIHAKGIPHRFPDEAIAEANAAAQAPLGDREDLRHLPILTIDPADARDHDDAVWAAPDDDAANQGGWKAVVAIADVSWFVRPGSALDREAFKRGNSVYFPDRVVPMLPEALSADACSLVANEDRGVLACHLQIAPDGKLLKWRFTRAVIRCVENIAYEDAQAAIDGTLESPHTETILKPLWGAWGVLDKARGKREPLELDLPERRVQIDEQGRIMSVAVRERLDAHRLIEEFMITANVAAAKALEAKRAPCMYRAHEPPSREKLAALKEYLDTFDIEMALGQVIQPRTFNRLLAQVGDRPEKEQISEQVLRTQTQAYYTPEHLGHFGLSLGSYAHFTSPIRRYSDLVVHRALVRAYKLGEGGLSEDEAAKMAATGEHISMTERRAMEAERDTIDRYVAAFLSERVGEVLPARITGVAAFGFFATVVGIGGDGLVPISTLGDEYFVFDKGTQKIEGSESGTIFSPGLRLDLRLAEANPITGALRFELPEAPAGSGARPERHRRDRQRPGGRPGGGRGPRPPSSGRRKR
ncbi:ribonuclease R [Sphingoaurantiacus capsulatus]|uniref:Ribonuclease R n=1 Tax=Sphingoaurantiacus capsulatus TaxID=1771310 RepID=A0ABV7X6S6_9SPHN